MHLTLRAYLILLFIALLGSVELWVAADRPGMWRLVVAVLATLLLLEALLARATPVALRRTLPAHVFLGQPFSATAEVLNNTGRKLHLMMRNPLPVGMEGDDSISYWKIAGHQKESRNFHCLPTRLGTIIWDKTYVRVRGLFGLAWWSRTLILPDATRVMPALLSESRYAGSHRGVGQRPQWHAGTGQGLLYLRNYRPGDPLRTIDWKATAKRDTTVVRVATEEQVLELAILIDCGHASSIAASTLTRLGHYANVAARLAQCALAQGDRVGILAFAENVIAEVPVSSGATGLRKIRDSLALLTSSERESNPLPALLRIRQWRRPRSLVIVLTEIDELESAEQLIQGVRLLMPKHLPLIASILDPETTQLVRNPASHWLTPYQVLASKELDESTRVTVRQLQQLGGEIVRAVPDQLDHALLTRYTQLRRQRRV